MFGVRFTSMVRRRAMLGLVASLVGCAGASPPKPPPAEVIPVATDTHARSNAAAAAPHAVSTFDRVCDRILDQWLVDDPSLARSVGLHELDGKLADYSAEGIAARLARMETERAELAAFDPSTLTPDQSLDRALLLQRADMLLFQARELELYKRSPQAYEELFSVNAYLDRDYAPIQERAERLLEHERAALAQVPHIRRNLMSPLSKPVAETAVKIYRGFVEYLRNDVPKQLHGVGSPAFRDELAKTNEALASAAASIAAHLADVEVKRGDDSHVLGPERYAKFLAVQEGLDMPLSELKRMGEENLAENKKAFDRLLKQNVKLAPLKEAALFDEAGRITEASRVFIIDKKLVTIPSDDRAIVRETPPFMRWNSAFLDAPGVFEKKTMPGYYYITRPDPSWSKKEQEEYISPRGILLSTTVHEVYPGHFLQGLWVKRAPTRVQKILTSYSFVEGWAHYAEQMMIEEGFGADSPENRLGQLSDALLRNCRVVVSLGIHTEKMTLAEAERRFIADCHQDKATAREQAARGAFDPGYFAYTLGKMQILALREEAKKRLGSRFSLRAFHDALLSHGSPPVPLIRDRVLKELEQ